MSRLAPIAFAAIIIPLASPSPAQETVFMSRFGFELVSEAPFLEDPKIPRRYAPEKLLDGRPDTSWAVGNGGPGTVLYLGLPRGAKELRVLNGYATSKDLFAKNNRVRRLKIELCAARSFPGRVTESGWLFDIDRLGFARTLSLADSASPQALELGIDWDRAEELMRAAEWRFQENKGELSDFEIEAYAKGLVMEYVLRLEVVDVYPGTKWNDTCLSELSFSPETRRLPSAEELVGMWTCLRGADFEELQFDPDGYVFSYSGGRPWSNGEWTLREGFLVIQWADSSEEAIYDSRVLARGVLTLTSTAGAVEVYEREESGAP